MATGFKRKGGDGKTCTEFMKYGKCKYGDKCSFSHSKGGRGGPHQEDYGIKDETEVLALIRRIKSTSKKPMGFKKVYKECLKKWPDIRQSQVKSILKDYDMMYVAPATLPKGFSMGDIVQSLVTYAPVEIGDQGTICGACPEEESPEDYESRVKVTFGTKGKLNLLVHHQVVKVVPAVNGAPGNSSGVKSYPPPLAVTTGYATSASYAQPSYTSAYRQPQPQYAQQQPQYAQQQQPYPQQQPQQRYTQPQAQRGYAAATSNQPQHRGTKRAAPWASAAPRSQPVPVNGRAREVWSQAYDPSSGSTYYYNQNTGATTWTRPPGAVITMASQ